MYILIMVTLFNKNQVYSNFQRYNEAVEKVFRNKESPPEHRSSSIFHMRSFSTKNRPLFMYFKYRSSQIQYRRVILQVRQYNIKLSSFA